MSITNKFGGSDGPKSASDKEATKVKEKPSAVASAPPLKKPVASNALQAMVKLVIKEVGEKLVSERTGPIPAVPSGSVCIDDLIGGTLAADKSGPKCPGYPRRHITEIYGEYSSGKTTAALQAIAETQKQGGTAMFLDFENALDHQYAKMIGVSFDPTKLSIYQPSTMEKGWKLIQIAMFYGVDIVVVDSVASMVPEAELKKKPGEPPKIGAAAVSMSNHLPKICGWLNDPKYLERNPKGTALLFLNQMRSTINTSGYGGGHASDEKTSGGKALSYYTYLRVKFTKIKSESLKVKDPLTGKEKNRPYGDHTQVKLVKSKVDGKRGFTTDIFMRYNYGIDDYFSLIEAGVYNKIITGTRPYYEYNGVRYQGRDKLRKFLIANPKIFSELRSKVLSAIRDDDPVGFDEEIDEDMLVMENEDDEETGKGVEEISLEDFQDEEDLAE